MLMLLVLTAAMNGVGLAAAGAGAAEIKHSGTAQPMHLQRVTTPRNSSWVRSSSGSGRGKVREGSGSVGREVGGNTGSVRVRQQVAEHKPQGLQQLRGKVVPAPLWLLVVLLRLALMVLVLAGLSDSGSHEHLHQQQAVPTMQRLGQIRDKEAASSSSSRRAGVEVVGIEAEEVLAGAVAAWVLM
jgi:hypothetical protein